MTGRTVAEYEAAGGMHEIEAGCSSLAEGTYLYGLLFEDLLLDYRKMVITK